MSDDDEPTGDDPSINEGRRDRLNLAIGGALEDGELLAGWVLVGKVIDADGDTATFIHTAPGQDVITDLGLSTYLNARVRHAVVCHGVPFPADDGE